MDFPPAWLIEALKYGGTPILLFIIWIRYNIGENKKWMQLFQSQKEEKDRDFQLLRDAIDTVELQTAILTRIEEKINNNTFCPVIRERKAI